MTPETDLLGDDDPVRMTVEERGIWAYLATVVVTSGAYLALMVSRLVSLPVEQISWVGPMLWTIGLSILGTIVVTMVLAAVAEVTGGDGCGAPGRPGMAADVRDREIGRMGGQASTGVIGAGLAGVLALAMLDADPFWIGNLVFGCGTVGAVVESVTKLRLYRRGF